ncbi:MAG: FG-GAP repeat protein, partial [Roseomonas sp.]|nr:FG-GAP repeat protein [Roseomonas sp.]
MSGAIAPIDLTTIAAGTGGFVIHGQNSRDYSGERVASAGDVNGDGFADLIIRASYGDAAGNAKSYAGDSYVVFGKASGWGAAIDLTNIAAGTGGFVIHGQDRFDRSGSSVASAGDINGDGFADLIIGARGGDAAGNAKADAGDSYVVFGK